MSENCKNENHIIGCGLSGYVTLDDYAEDRKHPGYVFRYCPECGNHVEKDENTISLLCDKDKSKMVWARHSSGTSIGFYRDDPYEKIEAIG